uniref:Uncharacterized protein n=1 Tax=Parascaris univalens TaxID=6257 RepID=A0A914ZTI7_PARUN
MIEVRGAATLTPHRNETPNTAPLAHKRATLTPNRNERQLRLHLRTGADTKHHRGDEAVNILRQLEAEYDVKFHNEGGLVTIEGADNEYSEII